jgi:hypothetical protein
MAGAIADPAASAHWFGYWKTKATGIPFVKPQQKITLGEMRKMGVRGLLVYCSDYKCSHGDEISADR